MTWCQTCGAQYDGLTHNCGWATVTKDRLRVLEDAYTARSTEPPVSERITDEMVDRGCDGWNSTEIPGYPHIEQHDRMRAALEAALSPVSERASWVLVFCKGCGEMLGVQDHIRIRDEHLDLGDHCGLRFVRVVSVAEGAEELMKYVPGDRSFYPSIGRLRQALAADSKGD